MSWFIYIVECGDGSLYTGITRNLEKRIKEHNLKKGARYTAQRLPVKLVWWLECKTESEARKREWTIKSWNRLEKLNLIANSGDETDFF